MSGHGLRHYVFWAALGALAGYGVAMTIVKAAGWWPVPERSAPEDSQPRAPGRSMTRPTPPPPWGTAHVTEGAG